MAPKPPAPQCGKALERTLRRRGCVERPTIWWMNRTLAQLPAVPSLAFVHVPVPEFMRLWNAGAARGSKHEDVNCPMHDSGARAFPMPSMRHAVSCWPFCGTPARPFWAFLALHEQLAP